MTNPYTLYNDAASAPRTPPRVVGSLPSTPNTQEHVIDQSPQTAETFASSPLMFRLSPEGTEPQGSPISWQIMHKELGLEDARTFGAVRRANQALAFLQSTPPPSPTLAAAIPAPGAPRIEQAPRFQSLQAAFESFDVMDIDASEPHAPSASVSTMPTEAGVKRARRDETQNDCDEPAAKRQRH